MRDFIAWFASYKTTATLPFTESTSVLANRWRAWEPLLTVTSISLSLSELFQSILLSVVPQAGSLFLILKAFLNQISYFEFNFTENEMTHP